MKLKNVGKSPVKGKKLRATFIDKDGKERTTDFGAEGYSDYTVHKDTERRKRYLDRHRKNENWQDPMTAGSLSKHLLWGESTSLQKNIQQFKKKFNL
jgi:hypothetical protein